MRSFFIAGVTAILSAGLASQAFATTAELAFQGPGVSGDLMVTYGTATDQKFPSAYEVTGISGWFTDTNNGLMIQNAAVTSLVPISPTTGDPKAPHDFSFFVIPNTTNGGASYDNLYWPAGALTVCGDYPATGVQLDVYGLLFNIGNGQMVNFWSNGDINGSIDYGLSVETSSSFEDFVRGGVAVTPEPGTVGLLLVAIAGTGMFIRRRRR